MAPLPVTCPPISGNVIQCEECVSARQPDVHSFDEIFTVALHVKTNLAYLTGSVAITLLIFCIKLFSNQENSTDKISQLR